MFGEKKLKKIKGGKKNSLQRVLFNLTSFKIKEINDSLV